MDASLGANSPSNFYRGFDGDDVLEHGGLFVATYNLPALAQRVAVRVAFPDGREFIAQGVVKWRRLAPPGGSHSPEAPPGFGLQFEQAPPNARQLVESYVTNREPLFHDND
jgi:Tfp pilus assembly protein PilZ